MARLPGALLLCLVAALPAADQEGRAVPETPLPLTTERAPTIPRGAAVLEAYAEYLDTHRVPFVSPEGSLLRAPVVSLRYGAADNVEFQIEGAAQVWGFADEDELGEKVEDEHEVGDFTLWTKWLALEGKEKRQAMALRWGVKLPNASDESGLGTDETDVYGSVVVSKTLGWKSRLDANLGMAILGDPTEARQQNDVLTYGVSLTRIMSKDTMLLMEVAGASGKGHAPPQSVARLGVRWLTHRGFHVFAAGLAGLTSRSPDWGALVGVGRAFHRKAK
jgi:hypothetical protein